MNSLLTLLLSCLWLVACNNQQATPGETAQPESSAITQAVHEPLDKAKAIEQLLQDQAEQRKQQADGL